MVLAFLSSNKVVLEAHKLDLDILHVIPYAPLDLLFYVLGGMRLAHQ